MEVHAGRGRPPRRGDLLKHVLFECVRVRVRPQIGDIDDEDFAKLHPLSRGGRGEEAQAEECHPRAGDELHADSFAIGAPQGDILLRPGICVQRPDKSSVIHRARHRIPSGRDNRGDRGNREEPMNHLLRSSVAENDPVISLRSVSPLAGGLRIDIR